MRKKGCLLLAALALLLAGCGEKTQKSAEDLQARYAQMQGYEAIVETAVPREDETLHYTLSLEHSNGETRAAVLAPEELTGVGAVLEGDKLTLTFDDLVLDVGTLSPRVSALSCVPLVHAKLPESVSRQLGCGNTRGRRYAACRFFADAQRRNARLLALARCLRRAGVRRDRGK